MKIEGKRILVDIERGRTVNTFRPRRLGGGLGTTRLGPKHMNQKYPGRDPRARINSESIPSLSSSKRTRSRSRSRERERDRGRY
jgi:U1 small nuclear ribonucleoprotein 70kDa